MIRQSLTPSPLCSLVFQLVEFARNLTSLLASHNMSSEPLQTSWPDTDAVMSDAEWIRRREAFDQEEQAESLESLKSMESMEVLESLGSPEEAEGEAKTLDDEMRQRRERREGRWVVDASKPSV